MKLINNLLVIEVPKESHSHEVTTGFGGSVWYCKWQIKNGNGMVKLPEGKWEVIGQLPNMSGSDKGYAIILAKDPIRFLSQDPFRDFMLNHRLLPTETTDLLFLKRIN